ADLDEDRPAGIDDEAVGERQRADRVAGADYAGNGAAVDNDWPANEARAAKRATGRRTAADGHIAGGSTVVAVDAECAAVHGGGAGVGVCAVERQGIDAV